MGEQDWRNFLVALGGSDWVVLHGGATTVFRVGSLGEAARLAEAVAKAPGIAGGETRLLTQISGTPLSTITRGWRHNRWRLDGFL